MCYGQLNQRIAVFVNGTPLVRESENAVRTVNFTRRKTKEWRKLKQLVKEIDLGIRKETYWK